MPTFKGPVAIQQPGHMPRGLRLWPVLILLLVLPFFGQSFHYVKDVSVLWAISKAFPVISLPLVLFLIGCPPIPLVGLYLTMLAYLITVPSLTSIFSFDQNLILALGSQVKILPFLYFFSFLGFLVLLRPNFREVRFCFVFFGILTYFLLLLFGLFIPADWYDGFYSDESSRMFTHDDRGYRIRMPMFFGNVFLFYSFRAFLKYKHLWSLISVALMLALLLIFVKQRTFFVAQMGVLFMISLLTATPPVVRFLVIPAAALAAALMPSIDYFAFVINASETGVHVIRLLAAEQTHEFLSENMLRWVFGAGTLSPLGDIDLTDYFGQTFFLEDIGWLGNIFEYGIIGWLLLMSAHVAAAIYFIRNIWNYDETFSFALFCQIVYIVLVSILHPVTVAPGEFAICLAIMVYFKWVYIDPTIRTEPIGRSTFGVANPRRPAPRRA